MEEQWKFCQPDTWNDVICCHAGRTVTLLPLGQLVCRSVLVSDKSPSSHTNLFKLFTEDKLRRVTSAFRRLLIHVFCADFVCLPDQTKSNSLSGAL